MNTHYIIENIKSLLLLAVIVFTISCKDDEEPFVLRDTDYLNFPYLESSQNFTVRTNGAWSVNNGGNEWISLNPSSGTGDGVIYENVTVTVKRNSSGKRSGKVILNAAEKEIYVNVHQDEGFLLFGTSSLSGSLATGEPIDGTNLRIPYSRALGNEQFNISVQVSGEAATGINNVDSYPVSITAESGIIYVPLTGTPVKDGQILFTVDITYPNVYIAALNVSVGTTKALHNADFVITGYMADPKGTDSPVIGSVSGGGWPHTGGYEYIQLLALKDIDFTVDPYCLVTASNPNQTTPGDKGWIAGKDGNVKTYQINIDQGSVKKGEFFYVGSPARLINSYPTSGTNAMTQVSTSKWPVAIDYYSTPGADNNGIAVGGTGILNNWASGTPMTNIAADGIAVFKGTSINENTVPMDAIFYGEVLTLKVFQVPTNDHYSRIDLAGNPQSYFGQGSNTWSVILPTPGNDDGWYCALGGEINDQEWITPRTPAYVQRRNSGGDGAGATVADIENIPEATKFLND